MTKSMKILTNTKNDKLLIANFEDILNNVITFKYTEEQIEIPGVVILAKEGSKNLFTRLLNPGIELIEISEEIFNSIQTIIESVILDKSKIVTKSKTRPVSNNVINLEALQKLAVFVKITEDSILINDYIFTNNESEFHGDGMFTTKKVYFVGFEAMNTIKNLFSVTEGEES